MAIFDIEKDDLLRLSEDQSEELIFRLAVADVVAHGHNAAHVEWTGHKNAPDSKIDIHVKVADPELNTGFLVKPNTILQSKKHKMPKGKILKEMRDKNSMLHPALSRQAKIGGSYIIASLADDCAPQRMDERRAAMHEAFSGDPNKDKINLNFFDRSKLVQWLRQYPSVILWVKGELGQGYTGWQPYGSWSNPPKGTKDSLILAPGVSVRLPTERGQKVPIEDAIEPMRELIRFSSKAIRITGLSGVGKTRIVQALFDETVGANALDRTIAVYADTGAEPDPSAYAMLDWLIAKNCRAFMILDNCSSKLHSLLASRVSAASGDVSLITVEYDIRDDKPHTTEVIHIEADGPEVAEELLLRRFPSIGQANVRRIAEFAGGNAKVSLAIAEGVREGESLATLTDEELFDRLFEQRKGRDGDLRKQAEVLSLVYSFSVDPDMVPNELAVLGSILGHTEDQLFYSVNTLMDRHIVQKRSHWRAILPHAVANRLAKSALEKVRVAKLRAIFEAPGRHRLLMSFAHRLGLMHDHLGAKEIVEDWLQPDGLLGQISNLDESGTRILEYIGPVAPEALLDRIEAELTARGFRSMEPLFNPQRTTILDLLQSLAYAPEAFGRCIKLLIGVADHENKYKIDDAVRDKISQFYQPYLSGTRASLQQRLTILDEFLHSEQAGRRSLGIRLLSIALDGLSWTASDQSDFGARPRDYGYHPNDEQFVEWRSAFVYVAVRLATSIDPDLRGRARQVLADKFRGLWQQETMREKLVSSAKQINNHQPWVEGWMAVQSMIHDEHTKRYDEQEVEPLPQNLAELDRELKPRDLVPIIQVYALCEQGADSALDPDIYHDDTSKQRDAEERLTAIASNLGADFATSTHQLSELSPKLFASGCMPYRASFGKGLARGAHDQRRGWKNLICCLDQLSDPSENFSVIVGFLDEVASGDPELSREFLDECAVHPILRQYLVGLHPPKDFSEADLDRCMALLDDDEISAWIFGPILRKEDYAHLPIERLTELAKRILTKPDGGYVLLKALSLKQKRMDNSLDMLGPELRRLGLHAATQIFRDHPSDPRGTTGVHMNEVIRAALRFDGNELEKERWLNTIFSIVDKQHGHIYLFEKAIQATAELMPDAFLNRVFEDKEEEQDCRLRFIRGSRRNLRPLSNVKLGDLIEWCQKRNQAGVWGLVTSGIPLWENDEIEERTSLTPLAIEFLEAAPEPEIVLQTYADRVTPLSWSVSRANIMQPRADAINKLTQHERTDVANAAKMVSERLKREIEQKRVHEQREDKEREQRFE